MVAIPVSVLMSTYKGNKAKYLDESLKSLAEQTCIADEIILIVDGEVDGEQLSVISNFKYKGNFKVYFLEANHGLAYCMNLAIQYSSNDILARMDADDLSCNQRFEIEYNNLMSLDDENYVVCSWASEFSDEYSDFYCIKKTPGDNNKIKKMIPYRNVIVHPSMMFYKKVINIHGGYDENVGLLEDYELHLRLIKAGVKYHCIQRPLIQFRTSHEQYGRRGGFKYLINEYKFRKFCYKKRYIKLHQFIISCVLYSFLRLSPVKLRKSMYKLVRES
ncbi:glycosyltransferase [Vibrio spartinae]|uniref:Glycosyltransferase EpsH n=1 Tax=Vibrio spartinae TaxID=1918945 RepID=A0ABX6QUV7_9VIBR|nr:glycosyltransferase [Vibrio spartinae]QMV13006.1 Putative glycosyltransferase EpsH [Vibrio spartinae]